MARLSSQASQCGQAKRTSSYKPRRLLCLPVSVRQVSSLPCSAFVGGNRGENVSYRVLVFRPCRNVEGVELQHFLHFYTAKDHCAVAV